MHYRLNISIGKHSSHELVRDSESPRFLYPIIRATPFHEHLRAELRCTHAAGSSNKYLVEDSIIFEGYEGGYDITHFTGFVGEEPHTVFSYTTHHISRKREDIMPVLKANIRHIHKCLHNFIPIIVGVWAYPSKCTSEPKFRIYTPRGRYGLNRGIKRG